MLEIIIKNLLSEALASPDLLSDLAGLEDYIAESYSNRSFIELLQNSDDAFSTDFLIKKHENCIFIANNGREFSENDLISLCRSASSSKVRGESIGYRGIGFKSVVGLAHNVHLISGKYEITFSRQKTQKLIPQAKRVPLIRIPHTLDQSLKNKYANEINTLKTEGYTTIFIFTDLTAYAIESEFESFNKNSLLFLRNILNVKLLLDEKKTFSIVKSNIGYDNTIAKIESNNQVDEWLLFQTKNSVIGFSCSKNKINKLNIEEALVYAFLPTEDITGLGILANCNLTTDPSRRHVIFDDETIASIQGLAVHVITIVKGCVKDYSEIKYSLLNALVPYIDSNSYQFKKRTFDKFFIEKIKEHSIDFFSVLKLSPSWFNVKDYDILFSKCNLSIDRHYYEINGLLSFLKYLGAKESSVSEIIGKDLSNLSNLGCVQIVRQIVVQSMPSYVIEREEFLSSKLFICNNQRKSLNEIKRNNIPIDKFFITLLTENGMTQFDLLQFLKRNISEKYTDIFFQRDNSESIDVYKTNSLQDFPSSASNNTFELDTDINFAIKNWLQDTASNHESTILHRWRSAEIQTLEFLNSIGFELEDVSKQNIGCDLEGKDPNGEHIQIEVKSIRLSGDKIEMTNNEIALAQEKKDKYYLAIVRSTGSQFEIGLIADPVNNLKLERQVVQWKWVCDNYSFNPVVFKIK